MGEGILIVDEKSLREKIYVVRGVQVMLDRDLAELYGYDHKAFNKQVKNNEEKFDLDFRFQLTPDEVKELRSKNYAANISSMSRTRPYVFTEQGIYMLMTVLKGEIAVMQSKALIRLFKGMKDIVVSSPIASGIMEYSSLLKTVSEHSLYIQSAAENIIEIKKSMENVVMRSELSDFMKLFSNAVSDEEVLILDGQPFKADLAYQRIYGMARKSVVVVDDYIGVKTLKHLVHAKANVTFTVISDNRGAKPLRLSEYNDFLAEYPGRIMTFWQSAGRAHDRYIVLDKGTRGMKVYHCGASSKDAGKRVMTITRLGDVMEYKALVQGLLGNPRLVLK